MRRAVALLGLCALFLLSACQVDAHITVEMDDDGGGHVVVDVTLDADAVAQVPGLADELRTDDLTAAGWAVDGPTEIEEGGLEISAAKSFSSPEEAASVLGEVTGAQGPLSELAFTEDRSFGQTSYEFVGQADVSDGVNAFAEEELTALLNGEPFGGNVAQLEEATGAPLDEQFSLTLTVELPGGSETWELAPGSEATDLALSTSEIRPLPWLLAVLAVAAIILAFLLAMTRLTRWVSRRRAGKGGDEGAVVGGDDADGASAVPVGSADEDDASAVAGATTVPAIADADDSSAGVVAAGAAVTGEAGTADDEGAASDDDRRLQLVVLDADGVVFSGAEDSDHLLVDFAKARGSQLDAESIRSAYHAASEGRVTTGELWQSLGVVGDPGDLTDDFLAERRVTDGVRDFLERMRARELPVAVVSNEIGEWSRKLRATHKLDSLTVTWLSSGDVGERLPGPPLYQRVLQVTEVDARNGLFISAHPTALDAARSYGFAAAWFRPDEPEGVETRTYPVLRSFSDLGIPG